MEAGNGNTSGSYPERGRNAYFIRGEGRATSLQDVGSIVVKLKGACSESTIAGVKTRVADIGKQLPEGLFTCPFLDRTKLVDTAIQTVAKNLLEGGAIVLLVLLGNWRAALVVAAMIPLGMRFALDMMRVFGVSANRLGVLDFGLIVDGAIIIVEAMIFPPRALPGAGRQQYVLILLLLNACATKPAKETTATGTEKPAPAPT